MPGRRLASELDRVIYLGRPARFGLIHCARDGEIKIFLYLCRHSIKTALGGIFYFLFFN